MSNNGNGQAGTAVTTAPKPPLVTGGAVAAIIPKDIEQAFRLAKAISAAGFAPKGYMVDPKDSTKGFDENKVLVGIMHGMELGMTPMAALQSIAVVNGMPTIWGDGALGLVRASGLLEDFREEFDGDDVAICTLKRKGQPSPIVRTFSRADAQKAQLIGKQGPWQTYPKRMMQMRARSWALRDAFADVLRGLGIREEVEDIQTLEPDGTGTYAPPPPRPTREQLRQTQPAPEPQPAQPTPAERDAAGDPDAWLISPESFPTIDLFEKEWARNLSDVCATPEDVDSLVAANDPRLSAWSTDRALISRIGALTMDADAARDRLKGEA